MGIIQTVREKRIGGLVTIGEVGRFLVECHYVLGIFAFSAKKKPAEASHLKN